jgi:hypothetical protein
MVEQVKGFEEQTDDPLEGETIIAENVTFEEFLTRFGETHAEWIDGKVVVQPSKSVRHQLILGFLASSFDLFMGFRDGMGRTLLTGVPMYLSDRLPVREPDLLIVLNEHRDRIKITYLDGGRHRGGNRLARKLRP